MCADETYLAIHHKISYALQDEETTRMPIMIFLDWEQLKHF